MFPWFGRPVPRPARGAAVIVVIVVSVLAGCSGSGTESTAVSNPSTVTATATSTSATSVTVPAPVEVTVPEPPPSVRIDVSVAGTAAELSGLLADSADPFGHFVSCTGLRSSFGSYSVLASVETGDVRSVSVLSADLVPGPGTFDATVRVEYAVAPAVDAAGTITIDDDRRSGSFVAFDAAGSQVEGTFDCAGGDADPEPLVVGADDGTLEAVEVFALLRSGSAQRILGLAVRADGAATVTCPGADGAPGDSLTGVRVVGDETIGAITRFELGDGPAPSLRLAAGTVDYSFDEAMRGVTDLAAAGTFGAEADGVTVDGAFRCS